MPRRRLLTTRQREQLLAVPTEEALVARYYTLTKEGLEFIDTRRRSHNRLGVAVHFGYLRYPGIAMPAVTDVSPIIRDFMAEQLGVPPECLDAYGRRTETPIRHFDAVCKRLGFRNASLADKASVSNWLLAAALRGERGITLATSLVGELRRRRLVVPVVDVIDRLGAAVRTEAHATIQRKLAEGLSEKVLQEVADLVHVQPGDVHTKWSWLLRPPGAPGPAALNDHMDRLEFVRTLALGAAERRLRVHQKPLKRLARWGRASTTQNLAQLKPGRQRATLVATLLGVPVVAARKRTLRNCRHSTRLSAEQSPASWNTVEVTGFKGM